MVKFYIQVIIGIIVVAGLLFGMHLYKESNFEDERTVYTNEIIKANHEKNKLEVEKVEHKAQDDFVEVEKQIIKESNKTRTYTKEMMEDDDVKDFTDSF